jgi:hypothetical protein
MKIADKKVVDNNYDVTSDVITINKAHPRKTLSPCFELDRWLPRPKRRSKS